MDQHQINAFIRDILARGFELKDVAASYDSLVAAGDEAIPLIVSALNDCANGYGKARWADRWWDGADKLCTALAGLKTPRAKEALLGVLNTDSRIVEFDRVRAYAAEALAGFNDASLIPALLAASKTPHAPIPSIKRTIESLGGEMPLEPPVVLAEVSRMPMAERIEHFRKYRGMVDGWSGLHRRAYYWWIGVGVENSEKGDACLPFYAASVKAAPSPDAAAWTKFGNVSHTPNTAEMLARQYPLPTDAKKPAPSVEPPVIGKSRGADALLPPLLTSIAPSTEPPIIDKLRQADASLPPVLKSSILLSADRAQYSIVGKRAHGWGVVFTITDHTGGVVAYLESGGWGRAWRQGEQGIIWNGPKKTSALIRIGRERVRTSSAPQLPVFDGPTGAKLGALVQQTSPLKGVMPILNAAGQQVGVLRASGGGVGGFFHLLTSNGLSRTYGIEAAGQICCRLQRGFQLWIWSDRQWQIDFPAGGGPIDRRLGMAAVLMRCFLDIGA